MYEYHMSVFLISINLIVQAHVLVIYSIKFSQ